MERLILVLEQLEMVLYFHWEMVKEQLQRVLVLVEIVKLVLGGKLVF